MNEEVRARLDAFIRPLHQDLDGVSRMGDASRIAALARRLATDADADALELILAFHLLGSWLGKVGNTSRIALSTGLDEADLRRAAASIRRLGAPVTPAERAVAAAALIDAGGVRGLAIRFAHARRDGSSVAEVAREALAEPDGPEWMSDGARQLLAARRTARDAFCRMLLAEDELPASL